MNTLIINTRLQQTNILNLKHYYFYDIILGRTIQFV